MQSRWQTAAAWSRNKIPRYLAPYLLDKSSTTQWMCAAGIKPVKVAVLSQSWQTLVPSENLLLNLKNRTKALVREVEISSNHNLLMLARAVFPASTLKGKTKFIQRRLDDSPLGELLFQEPSLQRSDFELALLNLSICEYSFAKCYSKKIQEPIWARRSVFWFRQKPILLTEMFLPALVKRCQKLDHQKPGC